MKEWRKCFNNTLIFLAVLFTNSEIMSEKSTFGALRASTPCRALGSCLLCIMGNPPLRQAPLYKKARRKLQKPLCSVIMDVSLPKRGEPIYS